MTPSLTPQLVVTATAQEVLPLFGVAYLVDDHETSWAVTKSTAGPGLDRLQPGQRVRLTVDRSDGLSLVRAYQPLS
jgi:hypothetical protein